MNSLERYVGIHQELVKKIDRQSNKSTLKRSLAQSVYEINCVILLVIIVTRKYLHGQEIQLLSSICVSCMTIFPSREEFNTVTLQDNVLYIQGYVFCY